MGIDTELQASITLITIFLAPNPFPHQGNEIVLVSEIECFFGSLYSSRRESDSGVSEVIFFGVYAYSLSLSSGKFDLLISSKSFPSSNHFFYFFLD